MVLFVPPILEMEAPAFETLRQWSNEESGLETCHKLLSLHIKNEARYFLGQGTIGRRESI
jgi:hypothetical protein